MVGRMEPSGALPRLNFVPPDPRWMCGGGGSAHLRPRGQTALRPLLLAHICTRYTRQNRADFDLKMTSESEVLVDDSLPEKTATHPPHAPAAMGPAIDSIKILDLTAPSSSSTA